MLLDALNRVVELARKSKSLEVIQLWTGDHRKFIHTSAGELEAHEELRPPRRHQVETQEDFIRLADAWAEDASGDERAVCWLDTTAAVLVLDDNHYRENSVTWKLSKTRQAELLITAEQDKALLEPPALVKMIRLGLGLHTHPLIAGLRAVDWDIHNRTVTRTERTKESLGKTIEAQVAGVQDLPEIATVTVPLYEGGICPKSDVNCLVEIDPTRAQIGLIPPPGEMVSRFDVAVGYIQGELSAALPSTIPIYRGTPGA